MKYTLDLRTEKSHNVTLNTHMDKKEFIPLEMVRQKEKRHEEFVSGKGANLAEMNLIEFQFPRFIITTDVCNRIQ